MDQTGFTFTHAWITYFSEFSIIVTSQEELRIWNDVLRTEFYDIPSGCLGMYTTVVSASLNV